MEKEAYRKRLIELAKHSNPPKQGGEMRIKFVKDMHDEIPRGTEYVGSDDMKSPFSRATDIYEYNGLLQTISVKHRWMPEYNVKYALENGFAEIVADIPTSVSEGKGGK